MLPEKWCLISIKAARVLMGAVAWALELIGIYVETKKTIHKQYSNIAIRFGFYLFNADICLSNTDISFNKFTY